MVKCRICRIYKAKYKDYRFIDSCGLQGKVLVCKWCFRLNDVTVCEIIRGNGSIDPNKVYYTEVKDKTRTDRSCIRSGFQYKGLNDERYIADKNKMFKKHGNGWWYNDGKGWDPDEETPMMRQRRYRANANKTVRERVVANS